MKSSLFSCNLLPTITYGGGLDNPVLINPSRWSNKVHEISKKNSHIKNHNITSFTPQTFQLNSILPCKFDSYLSPPNFLPFTRATPFLLFQAFLSLLQIQNFNFNLLLITLKKNIQEGTFFIQLSLEQCSWVAALVLLQRSKPRALHVMVSFFFYSSHLLFLNLNIFIPNCVCLCRRPFGLEF